MLKYMLVRETTRTTTVIWQETWGKICREAKESVLEEEDALSFIWEEKHKMSLIAKEMMAPGANDNDKEKYLTQKLELLVGRRDQIAHESDMSYTEKREITQMEVEDAITFIDSFVACVDSHV